MREVVQLWQTKRPFQSRGEDAFTDCFERLQMISPTLIIAGAAVAVGIVIGATGAWTWQGRNIDALKLEAKDDRISRDRATRQIIERNQDALTKAQTDAANRVRAIRGDAAAAAADAIRLRDTTATATRTAEADPAACRAITNAYGVIFTEVVSHVQTMAADADQCQSDLKLTQDAWPK